MPRPERPFDRLLRRRPERDPAPIIIGGTIAFLAIVIILVFLISSVFSGGGNGNGGETIDIAPGITARLGQMPALPPGLDSASRYFEFELEGEDTSREIGLQLNEPADDASDLGFYTYVSGRWQRQGDVTLAQEGRVAEGQFPGVPGNLAVLRVVSQTYLAAGSLPSGSTLHADANVNIVSTRDFTPVADGSIAGEGTPLQLPEDVEILPTVVGSGTGNAETVDGIIADQELQATHIQALTALVVDGGYDGVDLEYASVNNTLREQFTVFVEALAEELHATGAKLSLTLPPPTSQASAYEWSEIGSAVDYIRILPLANPVRYWESMPESMNQLVEDVDPRKVMLVVNPFSVETIGEVARPIGYLQAMALAGEMAVQEPTDPEEIQPETPVEIAAVNLDPELGSSPLAWSDDAAAVRFTAGGTEPRTVYIENSYSIGFKLELVQAYGLLGAAVSDASAQSDVPQLWPTINEITQSATVTLARPNESALLPAWESEDGDIGAGAGTAVTWTTPEEPGSYTIRLIVSDGVLRFGREMAIDVGESDQPDETGAPIVTLPPEESPTPTPEPTATPTPTPAPAAAAVEVGLLADGDDADDQFTNDEQVTVGSTITYLVTFDNDSPVEAVVASYNDNTYGEVACLDVTTGENIFGVALAPDDGDGAGVIDGGADEVQCTYTITAPETAGVTVTNVITGTIETADDTAADQDDTTITSIEGGTSEESSDDPDATPQGTPGNTPEVATSPTPTGVTPSSTPEATAQSKPTTTPEGSSEE